MTPIAPRPSGVWTRVAWFSIAPAICLILFHRSPFIWFWNDDFAWLSLPLEINKFSDLGHVLFHPAAQGTVRVFSERLYFLIFGSFLDMSAFSVNALPFRICAMVTWFTNLTLATLIGVRLTGSRPSAITAAILWTTNAAIVLPLVWASAYNEVLCAFCILLAFYARLRWLETGKRTWMFTEWAAYLAGFGVLEIVVIYPFIVLLHALLFERDRTDRDRNRRWLAPLAMFVPAVAFAGVHLFLIPKLSGGVYSIAVDGRIPATLLTYVKWVFEPVLMGDVKGLPRTLGLIVAPITGLTVLGIMVLRVRARDFMPLFCAGWFVLFLLPVAVLPNHIIDYYLTLPSLGLAWLCGWAIVAGWQLRGAVAIVAKAAIVILAGIYLTGSILQIEKYSRWLLDGTMRMQVLMRAVDDVEQRHPGSPIVLAGVDKELLDYGFKDDPFRLYGVDHVFLSPDTVIRENADIYQRYSITVSRAIDLVEHSNARVLIMSDEQIRDVTRGYVALLRGGLQPSRHDFVNVGDPAYAAQLGPEWYPVDDGTRWMGKSATVRLFGIQPAAQKLTVTGYAPGAVVESGPVTMRFRGNGQDIGVATVQEKEAPFAFSLALPPALKGRDTIEVEVAVSRVIHVPSDTRDLGMIFKTFAIQ